ITGQFFRQFAVTISVSTIISAINAITMTPSRAVLIFKKDESHPDRKHQPEALPWWIFGVAGGVLTAWFGPRLLHIADLRLHIEQGQSAILNLQSAIFFAPGALVGGLIGWFIIRPVNFALGWFFRGFNRAFDRLTAGYGWSVGK